MNVPEHPVVVREALRRLAEEARQRAATVRDGTEEHDFYVGVWTAARDLAGPVPSKVSDLATLRDRSRSFRDGYLKVANMAGAAAGHAPSRFPLPSPDRRPPGP